MSFKRTFHATRSDGVVVTRSSHSKVYSHCVAIWHPAYPPRGSYPGSEAGWSRKTEWASRRDLAEKAARAWERMAGYRCEILEVHEVTPQRLLDKIEQARLERLQLNEPAHLESTGPNRFRLHLKN